MRIDKMDTYGLDQAWFQARYSKDPSTAVGACILRLDGTVASVGRNGFARGVRETPNRMEDRESKLDLTLHAEENALYNTHESVRGMTIYVWPFHPCAHCASAIIQAGISRVVAPAVEIPERWQKSFRLGRDILGETGIILKLVDYQPPF